ncbi:O-linked N-acetylglucosamine transferase, SPINDLY family protein [Rhizobium paknamense]|uniref:O-linked N-acetylglucosamine transferase (SPINDLY family) n=1 Tax=Rhizobium paknamense TaxID=1206817 RepID=A0ABU0IAD3_9HYPH|nr:hypothetical protein [Rhizobium paknamense]MDQ0455187.1 putative O-linked N-acetylglucosamine transferase (SPINDLY family) [Rhizobium paknamense]
MDKELIVAFEAYRKGDFALALRHARAATTTDPEVAGKVWMLIANCQLKLGEKLESAKAFRQAAVFAPQQKAEFLKFAARLYVMERRPDLLATIAPEAGAANAGDGDFIYEMANMLLGAGIHPALEALVPLLDMRNNWHLQAVITHYQLTRKPEKLRPLIEQRYGESPDDSFIAMHYFMFCRSSLNFTGARRWLEMMKTPEDPLTAEILYRDQPLSRRYWSDDEAVLNSASGTIDHLVASHGTPMPRRAIRPSGEKLRIGYISSDLTLHATMYLLYDVFVAHDRSRFDITFFCHTPASQAAIQSTWDPVLQAEIVPVRQMISTEIAEEISRRGIDILVDLKGHTTGHRLGAVAISDAPVKATWIGYPGSVRGAGLDYHITDPIVTPDAAKPWYEEKLCRLPETYQGNCSVTKPRPKPQRRADHGLPEDTFLFASFNSPAKISPETMALWARVLEAVPDSLFWILCAGAEQQANLAAEFARLGIPRQRLIFAEGSAYADHISRVGLADLALDTFPYNGHTTTSDLLWGGLPVLTRRGRTFAARVSESLLTAIGLPELVAEDETDFLARAVALAGNREALATLRARLQENRARMPLYDTERFTRHLERAYEMMAARARQGLAPDHIDVPALPPRHSAFLPAADLAPAQGDEEAALRHAHARGDHADVVRMAGADPRWRATEALSCECLVLLAESHEAVGADDAAGTYFGAAATKTRPARRDLLERSLAAFMRRLLAGKLLSSNGYEVAKLLLEKDPNHAQAYRYLRYAMHQFAAIDDLRQWDALVLEKLRKGDPFCRRHEVLFDLVTWCDDEAVLASADPAEIVVPFSPESRARRRAEPHVFQSRIRLAYLFSDFQENHPVMRIAHGIIANHDPQRFDVTFFDIAKAEPDEPTRAFQASLGRVIRLGHLGLQAARETVRGHGIDILVDLNGPTSGAWPDLLNAGLAPVQVAWIGFPGSGIGIDCDYIIGDHVVTPDESAPWYHERFCRLPETYQGNTRSARPLPRPVTREALGLPAGFLFASFNNIRKLTPQTVDLWSEILRGASDAHLLMVAPFDLQRQNVARAFAEKGVPARQLLFAGTLPYDEHLSRITAVDLCLDNYPYNGHATTSDVLWAGVPLLTLKGRHFASRVSESLLKALDMPDLVADHAGDFIERAIALTHAPDHLAALRHRIAENRDTKPLFDPERFTRHLERGYEMMVERARNGLAPDHIDVPALPPRTAPFL